jgi:hypothetical protein
MVAARNTLLALLAAAALARGAEGAWTARDDADGDESSTSGATPVDTTGTPGKGPAKEPGTRGEPSAKAPPRAGAPRAEQQRASLPDAVASAPRPRALEVNPEATEEERRESLEQLRDAALRYVEELDTVLLEAEDVVSTCERSPANGAAIGGPPRHLEAKRARARFAKDVAAFERAADALERRAKAPVPEEDQSAARALARASDADVRALKAINEYVASRGDDKHEEVAKARAKLKLMRDGLLASQRMKALKALGLVGEGK